MQATLHITLAGTTLSERSMVNTCVKCTSNIFSHQEQVWSVWSVKFSHFWPPESHRSPAPQPQAQQAGRQTGKHTGRGASARNAASCWWRSVSSSSCGGSVPCVLARRNPSHPSAPGPHTRHCPSPPPRLRRRPGWGRPPSGWRRRRPRGCVQPGPPLSQGN